MTQDQIQRLRMLGAGLLAATVSRFTGTIASTAIRAEAKFRKSIRPMQSRDWDHLSADCEYLADNCTSEEGSDLLLDASAIAACLSEISR